MAKKLNPLTGQLEEDGLPEDPNATPMVPPQPSDVMEAGAGGTPQATVAQAAAPRPDPAAVMRVAAPGAKPADVMAAATGQPALESQQVTTKSPTSTGKVETKALKEAAKAADDAANNERQATVDKMEAEQKLEAEAIKADEAKQLRQWENDQAVKRMQDAAETHRQAQEDAALKAEAEADARVAAAQDKSINWDDRSVPMKILSAFLRAGSVKDAYTLGHDPSQSPVIQSLNASLAAEKAKKEAEFKKTKEWRDALKTKNADEIRRTSERAKAKIDMEVNAQARALLESDKTAAMAQRLAKNDPGGKLFQSNRDLALAELDKKRADARIKYAENFAPTVESGGTVTTNTFIGTGGKKAEDAAVTIGGKNFKARGSGAEPSKLREKAGATETVLSLLDEYDTLLAEGASPLTTGARRADIQSKVSVITGKLKEAEQLGALDKGVQDLVNGMVGDPTELKSLLSGGAEGIRRKIANTKAAAKKSLSDTLIAHGNDPAEVSAALGGQPQGATDVTPERLQSIPLDKLRTGLSRAKSPEVRKMIEAEISRKEGEENAKRRSQVNRPIDKR